MNNVSKKHEGAAEELGGKVKEGFGKLIGNEQMDAAGETCQRANNESGKIGWALLWLLGIPLPVLLIAYLFLR